MTRRTDELLALRDLVLVVHGLLDGTHDVAAVREAVLLCDALRPRDYQPRKQLDLMGGKGGVVSNRILPNIESSMKGEISKTNQNKPDTIFPNRGTWLSPFASAWIARFGKGSEVPWGRIASAIRNLVIEQGEAEVLRRWRNFLSATSVEYVNPSRFAFTFGAWDTPDPDAWKRDPTVIRPGESVDAYIARLAAAGY